VVNKKVLTRIAAIGLAGLLGIGTVSPAHADPVTTITIDSFGDVIIGSLVREYQALHPNIKIEVKPNNLADLNGTGMLTGCNTGVTADITAVEIAYAGYWRTKPQCFKDLRTLSTSAGNAGPSDPGGLSATDIKKDYLSWRWSQGTATNKSQFAIPTDVGGLQVAYRWDLFKKAGLPYKRDEVGKAISTWDGFIAMGTKYEAKLTAAQKKKNIAFMDNAGAVYSAVVNQGTAKYYAADGSRLVLTPNKNGTWPKGANKQIKSAWNETLKATGAKIGSNIGQFTNGWYAGLANGTFAAILAPAWMMEYIKRYAPATSGKWDIAAMPGGGGNQGGSFLTIPASVDTQRPGHVQAAWDFIQWYLAPDQQEKVFVRFGLFPSTPASYAKSSIKNFVDPFFNKAPVGSIYATGVKKLKPIVLGPKDQAIDTAIQGAILRVANKKQKAAAAWVQAIADIAKIKE
jgi:cellobiose transport system substrate-binding protein